MEQTYATPIATTANRRVTASALPPAPRAIEDSRIQAPRRYVWNLGAAGVFTIQITGTFRHVFMSKDAGAGTDLIAIDGADLIQLTGAAGGLGNLAIDNVFYDESKSSHVATVTGTAAGAGQLVVW